jgi:hypothetical protein
MLGFAFIYGNTLFLAIAGGVALLMLFVSAGMRVQKRDLHADPRAQCHSLP